MTALTRQLGTDGPLVSAIGFGCMGLSAYYSKPLPDSERFKVLDHALACGANFWDTADVYMDNEDLIGKWFQQSGRRNDIFLATKFAHTQMPDGSFAIRSDPEYVKAACDKSLKRLNVDFIDLYYCHRLDRKTPIEKTVEAMAELKREGKIKYIGLSECSSASLRRAHKVHPIAAVQIEYSPITLDIENPHVNLLQTCRELGVAVVAYSPLGRGLATGRYQSKDDFEHGDFRRDEAPRFNEENLPRNLLLVNQLKPIAEKKGCSLAQLTLAWLLAQGPDVIPIPGTSTLKYVEENFAALKVALTAAEVAEIRRIIESCEVYGKRYPDGYSRTRGSYMRDIYCGIDCGTAQVASGTWPLRFSDQE